MEEKNNEQKSTEFKSINMNNDNTYKTFNENYNSNKKAKIGFGKAVALPFLCGVIGAGVVVGTCFGVPQVRTALLKQFVESTVITSDASTNSINIEDINTQLISLSSFSDTAVAAARKVQPSIVGITVEYPVNSIFNTTSSTVSASGSGIIITSDGYILTNNHLINSSSSSVYYEIEKANKVIVKLYNDDTEYEGKIIGTDSQTDLAVIKIDKSNLTAAELGDSDTVQVGEFAMAIGNPLGLQHSVTSGIVSAVNREVTADDLKYKAIQTDAAINSGNSGGALVNSKGQVIGINNMKYSATGVEGVGFAIPINIAKDISEQLIQYNKVKRPYIGIAGINLTEKQASANNLVIGVYIKSIEDFSAAEKAGLRIGDVITEVEGNKITTMDEINEIKNKKSIGDTINLKIYRDGKTKDITVTLQEQP